MGARGSQQAKKNSQPLGLVSNTSKSLEDNNDTNRIELKSPLQMPMSHIYKCGRCGMTFSSDEALYKHRTRFCIGAMSSSTGKLNYSDDENLNPRMTPSRTLMKYASPVDKVTLLFYFDSDRFSSNRNAMRSMNGKINDLFCRVFKIWKIEF